MFNIPKCSAWKARTEAQFGIFFSHYSALWSSSIWFVEKNPIENAKLDETKSLLSLTDLAVNMNRMNWHLEKKIRTMNSCSQSNLSLSLANFSQHEFIIGNWSTFIPDLKTNEFFCSSFIFNDAWIFCIWFQELFHQNWQSANLFKYLWKKQ